MFAFIIFDKQRCSLSLLSFSFLLLTHQSIAFTIKRLLDCTCAIWLSLELATISRRVPCCYCVSFWHIHRQLKLQLSKSIKTVRQISCAKLHLQLKQQQFVFSLLGTVNWKVRLRAKSELSRVSPFCLSGTSTSFSLFCTVHGRMQWVQFHRGINTFSALYIVHPQQYHRFFIYR